MAVFAYRMNRSSSNRAPWVLASQPISTPVRYVDLAQQSTSARGAMREARRHERDTRHEGTKAHVQHAAELKSYQFRVRATAAAPTTTTTKQAESETGDWRLNT